jgi:hypothetical protein
MNSKITVIPDRTPCRLAEATNGNVLPSSSFKSDGDGKLLTSLVPSTELKMLRRKKTCGKGFIALFL